MSNYGEKGYIDFSKLWELLKKKNKNKQYLINKGIHRATIYKLVNNKNVTCEVIANLCYILNCQPAQIMEYKKTDGCSEEESSVNDQVESLENAQVDVPFPEANK